MEVRCLLKVTPTAECLGQNLNPALLFVPTGHSSPDGEGATHGGADVTVQEFEPSFATPLFLFLFFFSGEARSLDFYMTYSNSIKSPLQPQAASERGFGQWAQVVPVMNNVSPT